MCRSSDFLFRIPDSIGREIEKRTQSVFPLKEVCVRKVKVLRKPKFDSKCHTSCIASAGVNWWEERTA